MTIAVSDDSFQTDVLESNLPVLVDFWAPWCGPCRTLGPVIDKLSEKAGTKAKIMKSNIDENPKTAENYGVTTIPTVIIFRNGKAEKQFVGIQQESVYSEALGL